MSNAQGRLVADAISTARREVRVRSRQGLHARPVMQFVELACRFSSTVRVSKCGLCVDGKSPMELMLLEATCGTMLGLEAHGPDARDAVDALAVLVGNMLDE